MSQHVMVFVILSLQISLFFILIIHFGYNIKIKNLQFLCNSAFVQTKSFFCIVKIKGDNHEYRFFPNFSNNQTLFKFFANYSNLDSLLYNINLNDARSFAVELESETNFYLCYGSKIPKRKMINIYCECVSKKTQMIENIKTRSLQCEAQSLKYKKILDNIPYLIWQRDQNLQIEYYNSLYSQYLKNNNIHKSLEINIYGHELAQKALETQNSVTDNFYLTSLTTQNEHRLFNFVETPISCGMIGIASDITQNDRNKKDLSRYIRAHHNLLENSSSAMALYKSDRTLLFYNNAFAKLWDLDRKWLDSQPHYEEILENLRDKHKLPEQANFKKFKSNQIDLFSNLLNTHNEFLYLPDNRTLRSLIIPHALGGLLFSYEDVSNRLNMVRSYNTLFAVQKATLNNLNEAIAVFGEDGLLKLYNHAYADIWEMDNNFLESKPHISTVLEYTKSLYKDNWAKLKNYLMLQFTNRNKTYIRLQLQNNVILDVSIIPLPDGATLFTYLDVTNSFVVESSLRERNEILEKTEKLKSEFLTNISHELRSPMTSIIGFIEMLVNGYAGPFNEKQFEYIQDISRSSQQLKILIDDILDLVSIETGRTSLKKEDFNIYELVSLVINRAENSANKIGLYITLKCNNKTILMMGDKVRVRHIIHKLLLKAINSSKKLSKILVFIEHTNNDLEIIIEYKEESFSTDTNDLSGFDLNLLIAERLAKLHGGSVIVETTPEGVSKMSCKLPTDYHN